MHGAQVEPAGAAVSRTLDNPVERDYIEELAKNREVWAQVGRVAITQNNSLFDFPQLNTRSLFHDTQDKLALQDSTCASHT